MRRPVIPVLVLLPSLLAAHAGNAQRHHPRFSVVGGVNFAKFRGSDVGSGVTTRTGFHLGGLVTAAATPSLAFQTGLVYSQEGTSADAGGGLTGAVKIDYLQVPLYLKVHTTLQGTTPLSPHLYIGPAIGYKVRCKVEASNGGTTASADCDDPTVGLSIKTTEFGIHFGAGVDFGRFTVGGRYQLGLSSLDDSGGNADVKNSVVAVTAGYQF
jgi:hypothetical protein